MKRIVLLIALVSLMGCTKYRVDIKVYDVDIKMETLDVSVFYWGYRHPDNNNWDDKEILHSEHQVIIPLCSIDSFEQSHQEKAKVFFEKYYNQCK